VNQERTTWVECAYWTDRTAIAPYLLKGQLIFAEGNPEVKSFTRNDGSPGASLTMRVREVQLLGGRKNENTVGGQYESNTNTTRLNESAPVGTDEVSDDLPF
jgi:single-strand DNA-binding protein